MCLSPVTASLNPEGGRPIITSEGELKLPCGKCIECLQKRASEWATRAKHEISEHKENCFLTLTYDDENLPSEFIVKEDFQKFIKRLRKEVKQKIRYMVSHEYGSQTFRPHFHAIIFGYQPEDQQYLRDSPSGYPLFTSDSVSKLWTKGYHSIADASAETAYYIASYAVKGKTRQIQHPTNYTYTEVCDSMDVSKRPSIGLSYFLNNWRQILTNDKNIPRYYIKVLERIVEKEDKESLEIFLGRCNKKLEHFPDAEKYLLEYEQRVYNSLKNRGSHEKLAKHCIAHQKSSLHSSTFRADCTNSTQNSLEVKNERFRREQLKSERDLYKMRSRT